MPSTYETQYTLNLRLLIITDTRFTIFLAFILESGICMIHDRYLAYEYTISYLSSCAVRSCINIG